MNLHMYAIEQYRGHFRFLKILEFLSTKSQLLDVQLNMAFINFVEEMNALMMRMVVDLGPTDYRRDPT